MKRKLKIVISRQSDGYVGYPIGLEGAVVGQGDTYDEALANTRSAVAFHIKTFGPSVLRKSDLPLEAF